jgi:glycosyltransferase involved in cell wall biosynthesis
MSPTRICLIIDHLGLGGAQRSVKNFVRSVDPTRFSVSICSLGSAPETEHSLKACQFNVVNANAARWNPFLIKTLSKLVNSSRAQIIYLRLNKALFLGSIVALKMDIPFVYHESVDQSASDLDDMVPTEIGVGLMLRYKRFCVRRAAATIACAHTAAEDLLNLGMARRERLHVVPNGVELERFQYSSGERRDTRTRVRRALSIPEDAIVLINAGRFAEQKNWPAFFRAVLAARRTVPSVYGLAVGDGQLLTPMRALAHQLGVLEFIRLTGYRDDIPSLMAASDVLLFPSLREGDSNTVKEAMASGLPVVGFAAGDTGLAVRSGEDGYVVPVNHEMSLHARLCEVVTDQRLRQRLARSARDRAFTDFGIDRTVRRIEAILAQVNDQRRRREDAP